MGGSFRAEATPAQSLRLSGVSLDALAHAVSLTTIHEIAPATEIAFNALAGRVFLTAYGPGERPRILFLDDSRHQADHRCAAGGLVIFRC